jgi:hypothetical protein
MEERFSSMWNGRPATWGTLTDATPQRVPVTHQAQVSLGGASGSSPTYASCTRRRALCGCPLVLVVPEPGAAMDRVYAESGLQTMGRASHPALGGTRKVALGTRVGDGRSVTRPAGDGRRAAACRLGRLPVRSEAGSRAGLTFGGGVLVEDPPKRFS